MFDFLIGICMMALGILIVREIIPDIIRIVRSRRDGRKQYVFDNLETYQKEAREGIRRMKPVFWLCTIAYSIFAAYFARTFTHPVNEQFDNDIRTIFSIGSIVMILFLVIFLRLRSGYNKILTARSIEELVEKFN